MADGLTNANIVSIQGKDNKIWLATLGGVAECTINEGMKSLGSLTYTFNSFSGNNSPGKFLFMMYLLIQKIAYGLVLMVKD